MRKIIIIWALLISTVYAQSKAGFYVVGGKVITVQDTSSRNYLKAVENAGVVPSIIQNFASNYLVTTEKAIGTWVLMKAQYPYIGGTAQTHRFNINDPRDLDVAFRLTYTGTITHSALGMQGDDASGYADTKLKLSSNISANGLVSFGLYTNSVSAGSDDYEIGGSTSAGTSSSSHIALRSTDQFLSSPYVGVNAQQTISTSFVKGFYQVTQNGNNKVYINGIQRTGSLAGAFNYIEDVNYYLLALNNDNVAYNHSIKRLGYVFFSSPLTDTQAIQQSQIATSFNGFLSRQ